MVSTFPALFDVSGEPKRVHDVPFLEVKGVYYIRLFCLTFVTGSVMADHRLTVVLFYSAQGNACLPNLVEFV